MLYPYAALCGIGEICYLIVSRDNHPHILKNYKKEVKLETERG